MVRGSGAPGARAWGTSREKQSEIGARIEVFGDCWRDMGAGVGAMPRSPRLSRRIRAVGIRGAHPEVHHDVLGRDLREGA